MFKDVQQKFSKPLPHVHHSQGTPRDSVQWTQFGSPGFYKQVQEAVSDGGLCVAGVAS